MASSDADVWFIILIVGLSIWSLPFWVLSCIFCRFFNRKVWLIWFCSGILIGFLWHVVGYEWRRGRYWGDSTDGTIQGYSSWTSTYTTSLHTRLIVPANEDQLRLAILNSAEDGPIRVVGSGHSWSATGYTDGTLVDIRMLNKVIGFTHHNVTVQAGMKVQDAVQFLLERGYCLHGLGSIRAQAVGGVVSHGVHGPHPDGLNRHVVALLVLLANGDFKFIDKQEELYMWRSSMGMLGVIVRVTFRVFPLEWLKLHRSPIRSFEDLDDLARHVGDEPTTFTGFLYPTHSWCSFYRNIGWKRVGVFDKEMLHKEGISSLNNQSDLGSRLQLHFNDHMHPAMQYVSNGILGNVVGCLEQWLADWGHSTLLSGPDVDILPNDGLIPQFYEIIDYEYMIPLRHCKTFARELILEQRFGRFLIPICLRLMRSEFSCLSMAAQDSCIFGIESMRGLAHTLDVLAIEQRVAALGGHAHFGKVAAGNFRFFEYPCLPRFRTLRAALDPRGLFLTPFLATFLRLNTTDWRMAPEFEPIVQSRHASMRKSFLFAALVWIIFFSVIFWSCGILKTKDNSDIYYSNYEMVSSARKESLQ